MSEERSYYLGAHDAEIRRLGLPHRVWRPHVLDARRRAGVAPGASVIDAGAGPGYASLDLAEIVEEEGRVIALKRAERFTGARGRLPQEALTISRRTISTSSPTPRPRAASTRFGFAGCSPL